MTFAKNNITPGPVVHWIYLKAIKNSLNVWYNITYIA